MKVPITVRQPHEIPEVAAFEQAKAQLEAFREANPQFFQHYNALVEDYNQKLEAADKVVRAEGVACGSFDLYQSYTKYDWEKLYMAIGRERFLEVGGTIKNKKVLAGTSKTLELAISRSMVPPDVVEACTTIETRYHTPDKVVIL